MTPFLRKRTPFICSKRKCPYADIPDYISTWDNEWKIEATGCKYCCYRKSKSGYRDSKSENELK
jgi:Zn ribbon nucleic-acid-binding protein